MRKLLRAVLRVVGLERLFVLLTAALVVISVVLVAATSISRVSKYAREQAISQVELAAASAHRGFRAVGDEVETATRLLSERPTLRRLVEIADAPSLVTFLDTFRTTSGLSACAVWVGDSLRVSSGLPILWTELIASRSAREGSFVTNVTSGKASLIGWGAAVAIPKLPGAMVLAVKSLDHSIIQEVSARAGVPIALFPREEAWNATEDQDRSFRRRVIEWDEAQSEFQTTSGNFRAALPLHDPDGSVVGIVESSLPGAQSGVVVRKFRDSLGGICLAVLAFGGAASALLARRIVRPIERLRLASERIASGDLVTPIPLPAGREVGALATTMENMRSRLLRQNAEFERRRAEADSILGGIADGVFSVDSDRKIRYINPQAAQLLGVDSQKALGAFCGDVLRPRRKNDVRPCEEDCPIVHARFRGTATAVEHLVTSAGQNATVVITSSSPSSESAEMGGAAGGGLQFQIIRNETAVESSRRMRDAVLANISHEFRTPLAAQLGSIELLRDRLPHLEEEEMRSLVFSIERGTVRLMQLIDNLLESVRIEAGEDSIRRQVVAIDEIIEEAADLAGPLLTLREQRLEIELPFPIPVIEGDRTRLIQVFVNLLGNANKYSPVGSTICIGVSVDPQSVHIWVDDEGEGVDEGDAEAVWERFVRSSGEEPLEQGMGLGLWIVRSIVGRHGGHVDVGRAPSKGARFTVSLPRADQVGSS